MAFINVNTHVLAYSDPGTGTQDPLRRNVDWKVCRNGVTVNSPDSKPYSIDPGATLAIFSGTRSLATDSTTQFTTTLNPFYSNGSVYRMTWVGGTAPVFRTARGLTLSGVAVTWTVNNNVTSTISTPTAQFSAVVVGDTVFVPDTTTGDSASPFNSLNVGTWVVIAKAVSNEVLTVKRPVGVVFSGTSETVTPSTNAQLQAFSSGPVQVNDSLQISAGFSPVDFGTYTITSVNSGWVEFTSTNPLPLETAIQPTAMGVAIYTQARRYLRVESDQPILLFFNGEGTSNNRVQPLSPGDPYQIGWYDSWTQVWQLSIQNLNPGMTANVQIISAE